MPERRSSSHLGFEIASNQPTPAILDEERFTLSRSEKVARGREAFLALMPARFSTPLVSAPPEMSEAVVAAGISARAVPIIAGVMATVVGLVEAPETGLALPLDVRGTAFQHRVWQALREIPAGTTATYSEIAERIATYA